MTSSTKRKRPIKRPSLGRPRSTPVTVRFLPHQLDHLDEIVRYFDKKFERKDYQKGGRADAILAIVVQHRLGECLTTSSIKPPIPIQVMQSQAGMFTLWESIEHVMRCSFWLDHQEMDIDISVRVKDHIRTITIRQADGK